MSELKMQRCFSCGGKMTPKEIEKEIKWGDFSITVNGIKALHCEECGETLYTEQEVRMMQNLVKALSDTKEETPQYLNLQETAKILRVSNQTIYNMIKDGRIKAHKIGREWRFNPSDLQSDTNDVSDTLLMAAKGGKISEHDKRIIESIVNNDNE